LVRPHADTEERFVRALENADQFFMKTGKVHRATYALAERLEELNIAYAIAGAMALGAHGYERVTSDVDVLLTKEGLARFKAASLGRGYLEVQRQQRRPRHRKRCCHRRLDRRRVSRRRLAQPWRFPIPRQPP
jgi:hypothetical protein